MEVTAVMTILGGILKVVGLIRDGRIKKDGHTDEALFALYAALSETKDYVSSLAEGKPHNRKHENKLANMWHKASIPLRYIDRDLAERCFDKGNYWMNPNSWSNASIRENRIAIDQVLESTRDLLLN